MLSYYEKRGYVEASLGGKITEGELAVFSDELIDLLDSFEGQPFNFLFDYSGARGIAGQTEDIIVDILDVSHEKGAQKIVVVTDGEASRERQTAQRINQVCLGQEAFVLDAAFAQFEEPSRAYVLKAA